MLLKYIVSNFKSIGNPVEFSMIPAEEELDSKYVTVLSTKHGDFKVLRRGAFFGPNASGKSTFIESVRFAQNYITEPRKSGKSTGVPQFGGQIEALKNTSLFQFAFYLNNDIYEYGFSLTPDRVSEEWLMIWNGEGFAPLFTRTTNENSITIIDLEDTLSEVSLEDYELAKVLRSTIKESQKNHLFLYKLSENGIHMAEQIVGWFESIQTIRPDSKFRGLPIEVKKNKALREFLSKALNQLDTGVSEVTTVGKEINLREFAEKMSLPMDMIAEIESHGSGSINIMGKYYIFFEKNDKTTLLQLKFEHILNNRATSFNIDDESDGTQRLLDLLPILFQIDTNICMIYFIDEIDRSLHTKLSKYLLKSFLQNSINLQSQIIFTAHDVNLIDLDDFSKEEIWFIEKNTEGETVLKPFSDFITSENQNIMKDYLNGRFGAVPVIRGDI